MKHVAYNIETGDVIMTNSVNHLKRCVKRNNCWNIANNYPTGKWLFAHNKRGVDRIRRTIHASTS